MNASSQRDRSVQTVSRPDRAVRAKKYRGFFTNVYTLGEELPPDCFEKIADGYYSNQLIPLRFGEKKNSTSDPDLSD
jgi:hypothetical protein